VYIAPAFSDTVCSRGLDEEDAVLEQMRLRVRSDLYAHM